MKTQWLEPRNEYEKWSTFEPNDFVLWAVDCTAQDSNKWYTFQLKCGLILIVISNSIHFLELKTAKALEEIQKMSHQRNYEFRIKTSLEKTHEVIITPSSKFFRTENMWSDAEFYFHGILKDVGGPKTKLLSGYVDT